MDLKPLLNILKAARKIEILAILAAVCTLLVLGLNQGDFDGSTTEEEKRLQRILSQIEGCSRVSVMISRDEATQTCTGIVVVAGGADDMGTSLKIQRAVQAVTGLELNQIEIVKSG